MPTPILSTTTAAVALMEGLYQRNKQKRTLAKEFTKTVPPRTPETGYNLYQLGLEITEVLWSGFMSR